MPNMPEELAIFARKLWDGIFAQKVKETQAAMLRFYRAKVTQVASDGKITIVRPFDTRELQVGYVSSMSGAGVGEDVVVVVFGDGMNAANHKVFMYPDGRNL